MHLFATHPMANNVLHIAETDATYSLYLCPIFTLFVHHWLRTSQPAILSTRNLLATVVCNSKRWAPSAPYKMHDFHRVQCTALKCTAFNSNQSQKHNKTIFAHSICSRLTVVKCSGHCTWAHWWAIPMCWNWSSQWGLADDVSHFQLHRMHKAQ